MTPAAPCPLVVPSAIDDAGLSVYEFRALAHIARRAGDGGLYYGAGTKSAATCRMSLRQWRYAVAELERRGLVAVVERTIGRRTTYRCTTCTGAPDALVQEVQGSSAPGAQVPVQEVHTYRKEYPPRVPSKGSPPATRRKRPTVATNGNATRGPTTGTATTTDGATPTTNGTSPALVASEVLAPGAWPGAWVDRLVQALAAEGHVFAHGLLGKQLTPLRGRYDIELVEQGLLAWARAGNSRFGLPTFLRDAGQWIGGGPRPGQSRAQGTAAVLAAFLREGQP